MASIKRKLGTKNWAACFTDANGSRRQASTGTADRKEALRIADDFEAAARGQKTEAQIRKVLSDICERTSGAAMNYPTCAEWFDQWLARVQPEVKPNTFAKYKDALALARKFGEPMCARKIDRVSEDDVIAFRTALHAARAAGTTNNALKIVRMAFKAAGGLIPTHNPAGNVKPVRRHLDVETGESKKPFTAEQLRALIRVADDEDRGLICAGLFTMGQRLGDVAALTAGQVDLVTGVVNFSGDSATGKTDRTVIVPIAKDWMHDLARRVKGLAAEAPLFPRANKRFVDAGNRPSRVLNAFRALLAKVGLAPKPNITREGAVEGRRRPLPYSFHSLLHTATSLAANRGVSRSVAMDLVGHDSEAISIHYTDVEMATKRAAIEVATKGLRLMPGQGAD